MQQSINISSQINWGIVANCLAIYHTTEEDRKNWQLNEQNEMEKRLQLMIDLQLVEFKTTYWHFFIPSESPKNNLSFRIVFTPIDVILSANEKSTGFIESSKDTEWQTLKQLALNYVKEGNLPKLKIVTKRLSEIIAINK